MFTKNSESFFQSDNSMVSASVDCVLVHWHHFLDDDLCVDSAFDKTKQIEENKKSKRKASKNGKCIIYKKILNPCGESDQLIVHLNFAKNG
ncbi:unnamed protein product [Oikopleura dioica]|uniref:Uncharacterized protein n=1 Tax=Oikopleura dioica TaxID=34765 RepID=E4YVX8_OIKDI|nr:unnamed protein product [Oikopleura dioica]